MQKKELQAETAFTTTYLDDFVGLYLFLAVLKKGQEEGVALTKFKAWYRDTKEKQGQVVLKFNEQFDSLPIPKRYKKEITEISELVDTINAWIDEFYQNEINKDIDEVLTLIQQVSDIIKSVKPVEK